MLLSWCMQLKGNMTTYHFYSYFTIPTLVAILVTIICNGYPYLFRNLLHKIRCTTQPVVNSTPGNKSRSPPEEQPSTSQLQSNGSGRKSVCYLLCTNSGLKQRFTIDRTAEMGDECVLLLLRVLQHSEETREIPKYLMGSAHC
jgi:hypothetical protein